MSALKDSRVAIVIPVHNGGESFRQCLCSIHNSQCPPDELIVVCDGESDDSWRVAEQAGARVIRLPECGGPARARNIGAREARSEIIYFVDADVTVHTDTIGLVRQRFQQHPEMAALIGSYDDEPGAPNFLSQYKNLFHHYTHQISSEIASTFWGACGAVRRDAFEAVGGFDERYRKPCIEDIELGYRLKRAGYSIRLCKDIQVKHLKRWEVRSLLRAEIFYRALPWTELLLRDRHFEADLNLNHANRLSVVAIYSLMLSLLAGIWMPIGLGVAGILALILLIVNFDVYWFFYRKRGLFFAVRVIPWHWFYFLYGGGAFAYGMLIYQLERLPIGTFFRAKQIRKSH